MESDAGCGATAFRISAGIKRALRLQRVAAGALSCGQRSGGEIVVERNGKRYSIVYRFVDDNEARPHTIAGSYAGTVEFTNLVRDAGSSPL